MEKLIFLVVNPAGFAVETAGSFHTPQEAERRAAESGFPRFAIIERERVSRYDPGSDRVVKSAGFPAELLADLVCQRLFLSDAWAVVADRNGRRFRCFYCAREVDMFSTRETAAQWFNVRAKRG